MTSASYAIGGLAAHAVCAAAGVRDSLRTAQFYARDLSAADRYGGRNDTTPPLISRAVARLARLADALMSWGADLSIRLLQPGWRRLPSPFAPGFLQQVSIGIRENSLVQNPLFNAYFFRAAKHILARYTEPPFLVLEHRVDAARRAIARTTLAAPSETQLIAHILIELARQSAIARTGKTGPRHEFFDLVDPNIAVNAIACIALLFAEEGKPAGDMDEDEFFEVTGALVGPRLTRIAELISANDATGLAAELAEIKSLY